jgi:hypothetical protein
VSISDVSVAIYVSGPHRRDVLDAVSFLIERLKTNVPIWKKVTSFFSLFFIVYSHAQFDYSIKEFYEDHEEGNNTSTSSYCWKENK